MYRLTANMSGYLKIEVFAPTLEDCLARFTATAQAEARRRSADWSDQIAAIAGDPLSHADDLTDGAVFVEHERVS